MYERKSHARYTASQHRRNEQQNELSVRTAVSILIQTSVSWTFPNTTYGERNNRLLEWTSVWIEWRALFQYFISFLSSVWKEIKRERGNARKRISDVWERVLEYEAIYKLLISFCYVIIVCDMNCLEFWTTNKKKNCINRNLQEMIQESKEIFFLMAFFWEEQTKIIA